MKRVRLKPRLVGATGALLLRGSIVRALDAEGYDEVVLDARAVAEVGPEYLAELVAPLGDRVRRVRVRGAPPVLARALERLAADGIDIPPVEDA